MSSPDSGADVDPETLADYDASLEWWFSMASPVEQEARLNQLAYSRTFDMVDRTVRPDKPPRYRSPRK